jgi:hypothetical protein
MELDTQDWLAIARPKVARIAASPSEKMESEAVR